MYTLDQVSNGETVVVEAVAGSDALTQRLLEMGLLEGSEIAVLGRAPLGDPIEIRVRGYQLSLRATEARRLTVRPREAIA